MTVVTSKFGHDQLGGITFPLLADFHPKGDVVKRYGLWRDERGSSKRAIVIVDKDGVVRHVQVIEKGPPDTEEVLRLVKAMA